MSDLATLDTLVTVVDAGSFMKELTTLETLRNRDWHADPEDERTIAHLLCDQIEFANVIIMNKCDLVDPEQKGTIKSLLQKFNPTAKIIESIKGRVPPKAILGTKLFSMSDAEKHEHWLKEARIGEHVPETVEYGISSFTFRSLRPMHPLRFKKALDQMASHTGPFKNLLRAKGFSWIASNNDVQAVFAHAGQSCNLTPGPAWWASINKDMWPEGLEHDIIPLWHEPYGDRQQELVMIGQHLDVAEMEDALLRCVLTDEEFEMGPEVWEKYEDPFRDSWDAFLMGDHHDHDH